MVQSLYAVVWQAGLFTVEECARLIATPLPWTSAHVTDETGAATTNGGVARRSRCG